MKILERNLKIFKIGANQWCLLGMKLEKTDTNVMIQRQAEYVSANILFLKRKAIGIREIPIWRRRKVHFILHISLI